MAWPVSGWALEGQALFMQGLKSFKQKDFSAAQKSFNGAIQENPSDALSHYYLGLTNSRLGKSRAAISDYQRAIRLDPQLPSPLDWPSGCRFRTRCTRADDSCAAEQPKLIEVEPGHWVSCLQVH